MAIKSGDVVRLKSGGPPMTVGEQHGSTTDCWNCNWFSDMPFSMVFLASQLEAAEPSQTPAVRTTQMRSAAEATKCQ